MAAADYYLCDICGEKTFYDAKLDYEDIDGNVNANPDTGQPWPFGVGWMVVLCPACAQKYEVTVTSKPLNRKISES